MIVAVTGHRPDKLGNEYNLKGPISKKIYEKLTQVVKQIKPTKMITGMALGVDMLFANVAIRQNIPFIAAIPCKNQEKRWPKESQDLYNLIINHPLCEKYYVTEREYTPKCMQLRNIWMVDRSDILIAVWNGTEGGTKNCVDYAIDRSKDIRRINPTEL